MSSSASRGSAARWRIGAGKRVDIRKRVRDALRRLHLPLHEREISGDHSDGVTPVPIPNTVVKPVRADGTALATGRESRSLPGISFLLFAQHQPHHPLTARVDTAVSRSTVAAHEHSLRRTHAAARRDSRQSLSSDRRIRRLATISSLSPGSTSTDVPSGAISCAPSAVVTRTASPSAPYSRREKPAAS